MIRTRKNVKGVARKVITVFPVNQGRNMGCRMLGMWCIRYRLCGVLL
ncbi:MAG: hypothetical protein JWO13_2213 [Acidobacteriales bacterium]|nr:hypothetical protein [Terriglobales bacterium]